MSYDRLRSRVQQYYDKKIQIHGATARGVDWNSPASQEMRFQQLLTLVDRSQAFTINDFGCGYGALADYLIKENYSFDYSGFDISKEMIATAKDLHAGIDQIDFVSQQRDLARADFTVASGIFNVKLDTPGPRWEGYILETLATIDSLSKKGFAFNLLTSYSDRQFIRSDLYYADPLFYFDYCKKKFSRFVALLHDYPLYEFSIVVRKDS